MFTLLDLTYAPDALEPVISARTLSFHHGKHLKGYVDNLNKLIAGTEFEALCHSERSEESLLTEIVKHATGAIFNNAGQILNHNLYFTQFAPASAARASVTAAPAARLIAKIEQQWGTLEAFQKEFVAKGVGLFGSGWVWLQADAAGTLSIGQYPGADNPVAHRSVPELVEGPTGRLRPLLTFDVWEHAYYLDYQNRRADQLNALWEIVDWEEVGRRDEA